MALMPSPNAMGEVTANSFATRVIAKRDAHAKTPARHLRRQQNLDQPADGFGQPAFRRRAFQHVFGNWERSSRLM
jgi:hypothetical protein